MDARVAGTREMLAVPPREFDPIPGLFAGDPPAEFRPLLEEMASGVPRESLRRQLNVLAEADQSDLLPRIAVPALLIWGELDVRSPLSVARQFEAAIPDTTLVVIPGAGHVSNSSDLTSSTTPCVTSVAPTRRARPERATLGV